MVGQTLRFLAATKRRFSVYPRGWTDPDQRSQNFQSNADVQSHDHVLLQCLDACVSRINRPRGVVGGQSFPATPQIFRKSPGYSERLGINLTGHAAVGRQDTRETSTAEVLDSGTNGCKESQRSLPTGRRLAVVHSGRNQLATLRLSGLRRSRLRHGSLFFHHRLLDRFHLLVATVGHGGAPFLG